MAVVSTWVTTSNAGVTPVNTGLPSLVLNIPVNKTLKRVVIYGCAAGTQHGNGAVTHVGPITLGQILSLGFPTTNVKQIYVAQQLVTYQPVVLDDHNLLTQNRVYSMYHACGDKEIGANLQMSWGGPVSPAMRLTLGNTFIHLLGGVTAFSMSWNFVMKALYQSG